MCGSQHKINSIKNTGNGCGVSQVTSYYNGAFFFQFY